MGEKLRGKGLENARLSQASCVHRTVKHKGLTRREGVTDRDVDPLCRVIVKDVKVGEIWMKSEL